MSYTIFNRVLPRSVLLRDLLMVFTVLLSQVLCSCGRERCENTDSPALETSDSVSLSFNFQSFTTARPRTLDIFTYQADGLRKLLEHKHIELNEAATPIHVCTAEEGSFLCSLKLRYPEGGLTLAAIADCPFAFNEKALGSFDAMERIRFRAEDDNPSRPIMSAMGELQEKGNLELTLRPLWSRIIVSEINNETGFLLENPVLYLYPCNPEAELFRSDGFRAIEQSPDTLRLRLPCDLGLYSQYPEAELFTYPNDSLEDVPGCEMSVLHLECDVAGIRTSCGVKTAALRRAVTIRCALTVRLQDDALELGARFY